MAGWLPGYEQIPILGCTGPGSYKFGTPWKIVLHTTESPFGSSPGVVQLFQNAPCSTPHFCIDPGTNRKIQFIPIDMSAAALRGGQGGFETNRAHAVQVEICGYAQEAGGWSDSVLKFIGSWIADVAKAVPVNLAHVTNNVYEGTVAIASSPYRMSGPGFEAFDGVCGHIDVPFNDHYDPYHLDKRRCVQHALDQLGTNAPQEDEVTPDDIKAIAKEVVKILSSGDPDATAARVAFADEAWFQVSGQKALEASARGETPKGWATVSGAPREAYAWISGNHSAEAAGRGESLGSYNRPGWPTIPLPQGETP